MKKLSILLVFGVVCFSKPDLCAQEKDTLKAEDIINMSFNDLMNTKVISASRLEQQIKNVPAVVQVITAEQIKERAYFTLEEALSDLPGFQFRNILGYNSYVFTRGAPSQNNLILLLVDGLKVNELNSGGFYAGGHFNMYDIDKIEVVYGPASALYGTNAVFGVINIITKKVDKGKQGHVSLQAGSFNTAMAEFCARDFSSSSGIGYSVSGMYKTSEKADLRGAKGDNNWTDQMENFEDDIYLSAKLKIKKFDASFSFQEKRSSMTTYNKTIGEKYLDKNSLWDITFLNGDIKYSNTWKEKISFSSTLYYKNSTVKPNTVYYVEKVSDTSTGDQVGYYRPNFVIGIDNHLNFQVNDDFLLAGGVEGEVEKLSEGFSVTHSNSQYVEPPSPHAPDMLENRLFSYYLQANYIIFKDLSLSAGARHDFSSYYGQVATPRLGLIYNWKALTAKLLYSTAFRAPKPWDYNYGEGNKNLNPEKMRSWEIFLSYSFTGNFSLSASIYKNRIRDKLVLTPVGDNYRWTNEAKLNTVGFEFFTNYRRKNFEMYANYTYTDSYEYQSTLIPEISKHTANIGASYNLTDNLKINLRANYLGDRKNPYVIPSTGNNRIDDALVLNGNITFSNFHKFDFNLKVNNLLDQKYYHTSNRLAGRYRQPQRAVSLIVLYNL